MGVQRIEFGRREAASTGGCACGHGGAGCMCGRAAEAPASGELSTAGTDLLVAGMTCEHCVRAVTQELLGVEGVRGVDVQLVPEGVSRVRLDATGPIDRDALAAAIDEAGYTLAES